MPATIYIGTSGWHYNHWNGSFYPPTVTGYNELKFHSEHFNTVENNSSFYRIASEATYKTWMRMTPEQYKFSMKLNKSITHGARLDLTDEVKHNIYHIITTTQVLATKLGAIVIQLPPSLRVDINKLNLFLDYFVNVVRSLKYTFDIAIEFRNKYWFIKDIYNVLKSYNVALVSAQSSRYPEAYILTADIAYIRMHGPDKLFASSYTTEQLTNLSLYIKSISGKVKNIYVYFNNDFHGYALENAKELQKLCSQPAAT